MKRVFYALVLTTVAGVTLVACTGVQPDVGASVGSGGPSARAGVEAGRVNAGVSTNGTYASVDVIDTGNANVSVGTHGPSASVHVGNSPVRIGVGRGGWRVGF